MKISIDLTKSNIHSIEKAYCDKTAFYTTDPHHKDKSQVYDEIIETTYPLTNMDNNLRVYCGYRCGKLKFMIEANNSLTITYK